MRLCEPVGYVQFMNLVSHAALCITDSGGIQEETTYLDIPCLTVRPNTERPITVTEGTNRLVKPEDLVAEAGEALRGDWPHGRRPDRWDGQRPRAAWRRSGGVLAAQHGENRVGGRQEWLQRVS